MPAMELEGELTIRGEGGWEDSWEVLCLDDRPLIEVLRERLAWEERVALEADGHLGQDYVTAGVVRLRVELCGPGRRPSVLVAEVYVGDADATVPDPMLPSALKALELTAGLWEQVDNSFADSPSLGRTIEIQPLTAGMRGRQDEGGGRADGIRGEADGGRSGAWSTRQSPRATSDGTREAAGKYGYSVSHGRTDGSVA